MINELLKMIKKGIQENNKKMVADNIKILNRNGMDNYTIKILLNEMWNEL